MNKRFLLLLLLSTLIYFARLGGSSVYILDEAKNAGCAMEMAQRQDIVVPTFNGSLRTDKPPLHYFFMMAAYQVWGSTPFAARFFSALAGIVLIGFLYKQITKIVNEPTAFYTCLVLLSSMQLAVQFHLAVPDPYLILWLTICFFSFYTGFHYSGRSIYLMYAAAALAFMTKGLIAVVFPGLVILVYLLSTRQLNWKNLGKLKIIPGAFLFLLIALPWYIAVGYATDGAWLSGFFIEHNLDRYTNTMEGHRGFPLAPFVILIGALLPFSAFIIQAVSLAFKKRKENPFLLYCLTIVLVIAGFFSFSKTILPSYPAPALPFLALLLGNFLYHMMEASSKTKNSLHISFAINLLICAAVPVAIYLALRNESQLSSLQPMAALFLILPVGSVLGWYFFIQKKKILFLSAWSGSWIMASLLFFYVAFPQIDQKNPVSESLPLLTSAYKNHTIVAYQQFNPAYVFNLRKTITVIDSPEQIDTLRSPGHKVLIITRASHLEDLSSHTGFKIIYRGRDLFEGSETVLLAN